MALFASEKDRKKIINKYTTVLQCNVCNAVYTELLNVGTWECRYHPGTYDYDKDEWTCCGEKLHNPSNYNDVGRYFTWNQSFSPVKAFTNGCTPCDHKSIVSKVPYEDVNVESIAQLIPFMKPEVDKRNYTLKEGTPYLLRKKPFIPLP